MNRRAIWTLTGLVATAVTLGISGCGGSADNITAATTSVARAEPLEVKRAALASTDLAEAGISEQAAVRLQQTFFNEAPSLGRLKELAAKINAEGTSSVAALLNQDPRISILTDAALAKKILENIQIIPNITVNQASYEVLLDSLRQIFSAYGKSARGQIILNLTSILSRLEADATWGKSSQAFNQQLRDAYSFAIADTSGISRAVRALNLEIIGEGQLAVTSPYLGNQRLLRQSTRIVFPAGERVEVKAIGSNEQILDSWQGAIDTSLQIESSILITMDQSKSQRAVFAPRRVGGKQIETEVYSSSLSDLEYRTSKNFIVWWDKRWDENYKAKYILRWAEEAWDRAAEWGMPMPPRASQVYLNIYIHRKSGEGGHPNVDVFPDGWGQGVGTNGFNMPFYTAPQANFNPVKLTPHFSPIVGNILHEVFHLMQWQSTQSSFKYGGENIWFVEGTANWFERRYHLDNDLETHRLTSHGLPAFGFQPQLQLWFGDHKATWSRGVHAYASELFMKYLVDNRYVSADFFGRAFASRWTGTGMEYLAAKVPNLERAFHDFATRLVTLDGYSPEFKQVMLEMQALTRTQGKLINNLRPDGSFDENSFIAVLTEKGSNGPISPPERNRAWSYTVTKIDVGADSAIRFQFVGDIVGTSGTPSKFTLTVAIVSNNKTEYVNVPLVNQAGDFTLPAKAGSTIYAIAVSTPAVYTGSEEFGYKINVTGTRSN